MTPDERLLYDLNDQIAHRDINAQLLARCVKAIIRLRAQKEATRKIIKAAKAMYESGGISIEMRDALEEFDKRKRPMAIWSFKTKKRGTSDGL